MIRQLLLPTFSLLIFVLNIFLEAFHFVNRLFVLIKHRRSPQYSCIRVFLRGILSISVDGMAWDPNYLQFEAPTSQIYGSPFEWPNRRL